MRASAIYLLTRNEEVTTNYALKLQDYLEAKVPKAMWHRDSTAAWLASTWRLLKKEVGRRAADQGAPRGAEDSRRRRTGNTAPTTTPAG